jgi:hypothetical protein
MGGGEEVQPRRPQDGELQENEPCSQSLQTGVTLLGAPEQCHHSRNKKNEKAAPFSTVVLRKALWWLIIYEFCINFRSYWFTFC